MKSIKEIVLNAEFKTKIGTVKIVSIVTDGYSKGDDIIYSTIDGQNKFADDRKSVKAFINEYK